MGNYTAKVTYMLDDGQGARQKIYTVTAANPDNVELRFGLSLCGIAM